MKSYQEETSELIITYGQESNSFRNIPLALH